VPQFKELLGISRKWAIPLLEHFDEIRLTRRRGDDRTLYGS
jgi:selenocysteine-specific elongation factor